MRCSVRLDPIQHADAFALGLIGEFRVGGVTCITGSSALDMYRTDVTPSSRLPLQRCSNVFFAVQAANYYWYPNSSADARTTAR